MEPRRERKGFYGLIVCMALHITTLLAPIDARLSVASIKKLMHNMKESNHFTIESPINPMSDELCGVSTPVSLPPYESFPPLPENNAVFCMNTPMIQEPHYGPTPSPTTPLKSPPMRKPNSPSSFYPLPSPHSFYPHPSPPAPPTYQPPAVVHHPPPPPPPPHKQAQSGVWCVAKPSVPDPIIQEAMDYACGSGADCTMIQPDEPCFKPNTVFAHASYAFNSYWQQRKSGGGTCDFGGAAMLVTVDPSSDKCPFTYNN